MFWDDVRELGWLASLLFIGSILTVVFAPSMVLLKVLEEKRNIKFARKELENVC